MSGSGTGFRPADKFPAGVPPRKQIVTAAAVIGLAGAYLFLSLRLPAASVGNPEEPKAFPLLVGTLAAVLGAALLLQGLRERKATGRGMGEAARRSGPEILTILSIAALGVLYGILFERLGYVASTALFMFAVLLLFDRRGSRASKAAVSLAFSLGIYILFSKLLGVHLPPMPGVFW